MIKYVYNVSERHICIVFLIAIIIFTICCGYTAAAGDDPSAQNFNCKGYSVYWIIIDTLRADRLGCYGYFKNTSPNIDRFAKESLLFKNAVSQAPFTAPSHASMYTSLYPHQHKVITNIGDEFVLDGHFITIAEILKGNGYQTYGFIHNNAAGNDRNLHQGLDVYNPSYDAGKRIRGHDFSRIYEYIKKNDKNKPYFVIINNTIVHSPYVVPEEYTELFSKKPREDFIDTPEEYKRLGEGFVSESEPWVARKLTEGLYYNNLNFKDEKEVEHLRGLYDSSIYYCDKLLFENLINKLKQDPDYDKTIIIITADHGENLGDSGSPSKPGNWGHFRLIDCVIKVPLIIRIPSAEPKVITQQVRLIDIAPTVLELLGISIPDNMEGVSLVPAIQGEDMKLDAVSENILAETFRLTTHTGSTFFTNIKKETIKLDVEEFVNLTEKSMKIERTNKIKN